MEQGCERQMSALRASEFFGQAETQLDEQASARIWSFSPQPEISVAVIDFDTREGMELTAVNDHQQFQFSCQLRGQVAVQAAGQQLLLEPGALMTSYVPGEQFRLSISPDVRSLEMKISPDTLHSLAGDQFAETLLRVQRQQKTQMNGRHLQARQSASQLAQLICQGEAPDLRVYAATLDYLSWQLQHCGDDPHSLPPRQQKQLKQAQEMLLSDLSAPPTIAELSRATGLNQLKLKQGFRQLFGDSIYAYFLRHRLERGRDLLKHHSVTETAMLLGYSNISHFSNAFRKQFGVLPRDIRRLG